jgi:hypothetical protein
MRRRTRTETQHPEPTRVFLQIPITLAERRAFKHRAVDDGATLAETVRRLLGLPAAIPAGQESAMP